MTDSEERPNRNISINEGNYNERIEGDYVEGNYYNVSFNFRRQNKNYANIRQKLLQIVNERIESIINSSLNNRVYMALDMEQDPEQIEAPFLGEVKVNFQHKTYLNNTEIIDVFDDSEVAGRLLILGQPGAGKTTMLYKLAFELVKRALANSNHPIPVIVSLSSCQNDNQSIKDWLVNELKDRYGVRKDIGKELVENQEIIPLLDGLDELAAERQKNCVIKINEFLQPLNWTNPVVVCSRLKEYERHQALLQLNNSIELCPLSRKQVYQYLQNTGQLQLWDSISNDADLSELAKTPLLLNIIVLTASEISIQTWQQFKTSESRLSYLFDTYISKMFRRPYKGKQPKQENTRVWLGWLAQRLIESSTTEFLIERMQPYWLVKKRFRVLYSVCSSIVLAVIVVPGSLTVRPEGWFNGLINTLILGLIFGLFFGLFYGLRGQIKDEIKTVETLKLDFNKFLFWSIPGLIYGLVSWLSGNIWGLFYGLIWGLIIGLRYGIYGLEVEHKKIPNQGIYQSLINTVIMSPVFVLLATLFFISLQKINFNSKSTLIEILFHGLCCGLSFGIVKSGRPAIEHFILRIILWFSGCIPWNYAKFLNYSTNRLFLQRVGGGYRFIHDLLRQHFAKSYIQNK